MLIRSFLAPMLLLYLNSTNMSSICPLMTSLRNNFHGTILSEQLRSSRKLTRNSLLRKDGHAMSFDTKPTEAEYLAMFNRAVEYNDSVAWQFLQDHFSGMMHYWLRQY